MTVLVVGAAVSGRAATDLLRKDGEKVVVYDSSPAAGVGVEADEVRLGEWDRSFLDGIDLVVTSPGVPEHAPPLADALRSGVPIWSEIELAFRHLEAPIAAVTATNGKTTVTEAASGMLVNGGLRAAAVGNIGDPLSGAVESSWDALVVEASSFQLRFVESFKADCAVLLNVAPDHLDWHGTFEAYAAAKQRILERQTESDIVVFDADDPGASGLVGVGPAKRIPVSGISVPSGGWGVEEGVLLVGDARIALEDMHRSDPAFVVDIAAAAVAAAHLGADAVSIEAGARTYRPGRHRREVVGEWAGVTWINDSKATNPHAALAAIRAYPSVVLIAGGRAKGLDVTPLALEPNLKGIVAIGEAADQILECNRAAVAAGSMEEAVSVADELSTPGDTILLAPGCASFDMFESYADRGDAFRIGVISLKGG
jgi:UDP-N-acetylmuramoylalanine--D-glutamate ligase